MMNYKVLYLLVLGLLCWSFTNFDSRRWRDKKQSPSSIENIQEMKKLRHLVLFKFKESATNAEVKTIEKEFSELPSKIEQIKGFEWGVNISPENLDKGFTHGFLLTFDSEEARDIYLPHPDHQLFVKIIEPFIEDVLVIDYWTNSN